jgi:deoxyribose-phosphate aldolase
MSNRHTFDSCPVDQVMVEERCARFQTRSIKKSSKMHGLYLALNMIDLTTLEGRDTPVQVKHLCYKAAHMHDAFPGLPSVAAVCVYPSMVKTARASLGESNIRVASVSTAFPSGQAPWSTKKDDTLFAIDQGANEIDMVISRGEFLRGNYAFVFDEIASVKSLCGEVLLKVIFETGELSTLDNVRHASDLAIAAGADFIKTSTGKISPAATMPVTYVMIEAVRDHYLKTGRMVGIKPAGGISTAKSALQYLVMVKETLGEAWLSNQWFRFGASSLANDLLMQIMKEQTGVYQGSDYFSKD